MIQGVGHIGILVRDLDQSVKLFQDLLGAELHEVKTVEEQGVKAAMLSFPHGT
jgi:methylmalonyl-CoA/ethylmalonyl-CoA epimerase